jgi:predicted PurR-regulated permease PerM
MSDTARFRKGFLIALVIGVSVAFFYVVSDFLLTAFMAAIFAGLARPLYLRVLEALGGRRPAASIVTLLIIVTVIGAPLVFVITVVTNQAIELTSAVTPWVTQMVDEPTRLNNYLDRIPGIERLAPYREQLLARAGAAAGSFGEAVLRALTDTTRGTLSLILDLFIVLYAMFFFLMDGPKYLEKIAVYLPLRETEQEQMLDRFVSVARATLKGTLFIGLVQGALGGLALAVAGISGAVLWGLMMVVLSVIPVIGGAIIWVPAAIVLLVRGEWFNALLLTLFCSLVIGSVDNLLRPRLVGQDIQMSTLLILFSTLGGIAVFGAIGFILGPIVAALFVTMWEIFRQAYRDDLDAEPTPRIEVSG